MERNSPLYLSFLIIFLILGCSENETTTEADPFIESERVFDNIPSGSGLVITNDTAFIIGDDATAVYLLNLENFKHQKLTISGIVSSKSREPKATKHDFESATLVNWNGKRYLLAFGSGSQIDARDSLLVFNLDDNSDQRIVSMHQFYEELQRLTNTDSMQWNLEGATVMGKSLILCNRGNNMVFEIVLIDFLKFLFEPDSSFPPVLFHRVRMPRIDNKEARLSGVCSLNDSVLIFSASVEDTPDWTKDGPVIGSFICIYSIREFEILDSYPLERRNGIALKEKIESLDVLNKDDKGVITLIAIADNDNGSSKLFRLKLSESGSASVDNSDQLH